MADILVHLHERSSVHVMWNLSLTLPKVTTKISDPSLAVGLAFETLKSTSLTLSFIAGGRGEIHDLSLPEAQALSLIKKCDLGSMAFCYSYYAIPCGFPRDPDHQLSDRCPSLWFFLCPAVSLASDKQWLSCQLPNYRTV